MYHSHPTFFSWGDYGTRYNRSKSGWIDTVTFSDWFEFHLLPILKKKAGRKVVISDNLSSHFNYNVLKLCEENDIRFIALAPNATHLLQPLDVAFFRPMKEGWRKTLSEWKETAYGRRCGTIPKQDFPKLLRELMVGLEQNSVNNMKAGFKKCGILPFNPAKVLDRLHDSVMTSLPQHVEKISKSFMDHLSKTREDLVQKPQRKKRLNLPPGRGITSQDVESVQAETQDAPAEKKKKTTEKKVKNPVTKKIQKDKKGRSTNKKQGRAAVNRRRDSESESDVDEQSFSLQDTDDSVGDISFSEDEVTDWFPFEMPQVSTSNGCASTPPPTTSNALDSTLQLSSSCAHTSMPQPSTSYACASPPLVNVTTEQNPGGKNNEDIRFEVGDFVAVMFESKKLPGQVTRIDSRDCEVLCMRSRRGSWMWPPKAEKCWFSRRNVLRKIPAPVQKGNKNNFFVEL